MAITLDGTNGITHSSGTNQKVSLASETAVASTSGTSVNFILSADVAPYVKRVTVMFNGVSTSGTSNYQIQIGAGSVTSSGYAGSSVDGPTLAGTTFTSGFGIRVGSAAAVVHGLVVLTLISGNIWVASGNFSRSDSGVFISTGGSVTLSGTLDRLRITTVNGTDTFDAGSINILYE